MIREYPRRSNERSINRSIGKNSGDLGERIAYRFLIEKGFEVLAFRDLCIELGVYRNFKNGAFSEAWLRKFFDKKHLQEFIAYIKAWTDDADTPSGHIRKIWYYKKSRTTPKGNKISAWINISPSDKKSLKRWGIKPPSNVKMVPYILVRSSNFGPDWVGKKDGRYYLIEVKTNRAILLKFQKDMLVKAKEFDLVPLLIKVKVEVKVLHDKVDVQVPLEQIRIIQL